MWLGVGLRIRMRMRVGMCVRAQVILEVIMPGAIPSKSHYFRLVFLQVSRVA